MNAISLLIAAFLAFGAVWAVFRGDVYWAAVAVWACALITLPYINHGDLERSSINWLMLLIALPYLASILSGPTGSGLLPLGSLEYLVLSSAALFALCMVTIAYINSCSGMDINLKFGMQVAFMFYASMIIIQVPAFYYSDLWLGTSIISSNTEIMAYTVLAMANGLLLTVGLYAVARARLLRQDKETKGVTGQ
jgi:hypothetical protein